MRILVTGSTGQLGSELRAIGGIDKSFSFIFTDRQTLPLEELSRISKILDDLYPDVIVNAAAYTAVDKAEENPQLADLVNHLAVKEIAKWCCENQRKLIHISTDYVFSSSLERPINENETPNPISVYGKTKRDGELAIKALGTNAIIIRTSWVYSQYGTNFVKTMLGLMKERDEISVVNDQKGSPTNARDLASFIVEVIKQNQLASGVCHYCNHGVTTWYDFARTIRDFYGFTCSIKAISTAEYPTPAQRPRYSVLSTTKTLNLFKCSIPDWKTSLFECLSQIKEEKR